MNPSKLSKLSSKSSPIGLSLLSHFLEFLILEDPYLS